MRIIANLLTFFFLSLSLSSWSCSAEEQTSPLSSSSAEKRIWIETMKKNLPQTLCQKEHYFLQCFTVTPKECTEFTQLLVNACLNNVELALPSKLTPQQRDYWGIIVGRCSYDLFEKFMQPKKRDIKECKAQSKTPENLPKH